MKIPTYPKRVDVTMDFNAFSFYAAALKFDEWYRYLNINGLVVFGLRTHYQTENTPDYCLVDRKSFADFDSIPNRLLAKWDNNSTVKLGEACREYRKL